MTDTTEERRAELAALKTAMEKRHSVRQYKNIPIEGETLAKLQSAIDAFNAESGLRMHLVTEEPRAFDCALAHYGRFEGVRNYIALVGKKSKDLDEICGYYGEKLVLLAQTLGLHTCWVVLTYQKIPEVLGVEKGEKLTAVITVGYGRNKGFPRKSKRPEEVSNVTADSPPWFRAGVEAALLAPTATNQQKFFLTLKEDGSIGMKAGIGPCTKMDLGIVRYHFEVGAACAKEL